MEVEIPTINGAPTGTGVSGLTPALLEMLRGGGGLSGLGLLLANAQLSPEQRVVVDALQSLANDGTKAHEPNETPVNAQRNDALNEGRTRRRRRYQEIEDNERPDSVERELADLREVNDTLAAALGACRVCWGGDDNCPICEGDGHSGGEEPNAALFEALVVPAVRRMRARRPMRSHIVSSPHRE